MESSEFKKMPSKTACCGKDIFAVVQGMAIFDIVLAILSMFLSLVNAFTGPSAFIKSNLKKCKNGQIFMIKSHE